jgi:hypothetical protein
MNAEIENHVIETATETREAAPQFEELNEVAQTPQAEYAPIVPRYSEEDMTAIAQQIYLSALEEAKQAQQVNTNIDQEDLEDEVKPLTLKDLEKYEAQKQTQFEQTQFGQATNYYEQQSIPNMINHLKIDSVKDKELIQLKFNDLHARAVKAYGHTVKAAQMAAQSHVNWVASNYLTTEVNTSRMEQASHSDKGGMIKTGPTSEPPKDLSRLTITQKLRAFNGKQL